MNFKRTKDILMKTKEKELQEIIIQKEIENKCLLQTIDEQKDIIEKQKEELDYFIERCEEKEKLQEEEFDDYLSLLKEHQKCEKALIETRKLFEELLEIATQQEKIINELKTS